MVGGDRHALVIGSDDDHVMAVMRDGRGHGTRLAESETLHQPNLNLARSAVALDQGHFGQIAPIQRANFSIHHID